MTISVNVDGATIAAVLSTIIQVALDKDGPTEARLEAACLTPNMALDGTLGVVNEDEEEDKHPSEDDNEENALYFVRQSLCKIQVR